MGFYDEYPEMRLPVDHWMIDDEGMVCVAW